MAITASGYYLLSWIDALDGTIVLNLDLETHKGALFTDTITPNFDTDTAYNVAPYNANETSGGAGWPAGGVALTGTALSISPAGTMMFDATDVSQTPTDITNGMGYLLYADALAGNNAILLVDFVTAVTTVNGQLDITWAGTGVGTIDFTP